METIEESPPPNLATEAVKVTVVNCEPSSEAEPQVESNVCHKSNGIVESKDSEQVQPCADDYRILGEENPANTIIEDENNTYNVVNEQDTTAPEMTVKETNITDEVTKDNNTPTETEECDGLGLKLENDEEMHGGDVEVDGIVETVSENVRFETEILIETNVEEQSSKFKIIYSDTDDPDHTNNILSELGQNIELSEVLRSSDVTENAENNNCDVRQEVFNKEELLDILEGNDVDESKKVITENFSNDCKKLETQLALQQLSRLKQARKSRHTPKKPVKRNTKKIESPKEESVKKKTSTPKEDGINVQKNSDSNVEPKKESIVNALVKDWEDDEAPEGDQAKKVIEESENVPEESEDLVKSQEANVNESQTSTADASMSEGQTSNLNKSDSDTQSQQGQLSRRESYRGRVIKKKVIFDPDNPDTFTKTKVAIKKENQSDKDQKDQPTPKKTKTDPTSPRSKSKSPVQSKLQWKKPQPKNMKQNKRLTEIDRLLMDEGAVNMICQLTPEAPKGHKNMKSKAEFIKKIQSLTPDGKEMKFRERKKELKCEEGDAKRIGSGKERLSLSSSVKSPTVSEDFEAHSADDSIIYRRHSSSSYSSPCMSPRRLSDVETIAQNALATSQTAASEGQAQSQEGTVPTGSDVFMSDNAGLVATGVINKSDFLSIKEKLNSKLSQALNKRKRDSSKAEKPPKIKKVSKSTEKPSVVGDYKYVRLSINQKLAEICIQHAGSVYNVEVMNELKTVLETVENKNDVSVTLLTAESGNLCSGLELKPILDHERGSNYAQEMAESVKLLQYTLESHSKLVCAAVEGRCYGFALPLVALSDITVASEKASFELSSYKNAPLHPGAAALTARGMSQSLLNEIIVFERPISAAEALQSGLVTRTVWPERCLEQVRAIAKDIAAQPTENIMLKKQLLRLKRGGSEVFLAGLEKERELFVKYWTSAEGRELVRTSLEASE